MPVLQKIWFGAFACLIVLSTDNAYGAQSRGSIPEAGPENGGLRLRLVVRTGSQDGKDAHDVTVEVINVTTKPITLVADWPYEADKGNFREYLEAALSIETFPKIAPWVGQTMEDHRTSPQPQYVLKSGEGLTLKWLASGRCLKNKVTRPIETANPVFPSGGLYAVHAVIPMRTTVGSFLLRSNEQLVSIGGNRELPKHTFGEVMWVDRETRTAGIDLGSLHEIENGDHFLIRTGMASFWRLRVTRVHPARSEGALVPADAWGRGAPETTPGFPKNGTTAKLITTDQPHDQ